MKRLPSRVVAANNAKAHFSELLERVADGEEITITRHGTPIARLLPVRRKSTPEDRRATIESMRALASQLRLGGVRIRDLIDKGRR